MTSTMSSGTKLVKDDKITYWMDPHEHLSGTSVDDIHASKLTTSWNNATLTNATYSSDNQGIYSMSSGGKIQFPTSTSNNPFRSLWQPSSSGALNRTISAWVYCTSSNAVTIYSTSASGTNNYSPSWSLNVESNGKLRMRLNKIVQNPNAGPILATGYYESSSSMVDYDEWNYLTLTTEDNGLSGSNRWMVWKFYKNGVFVEQDPNRTFLINSQFRADTSITWNFTEIDTTQLFSGDDHKAGPLYVHDVTLTAAEIQQNYKQHKPRFQEG